MYPKLWQNEGLTYSELIDNLIELSFEEYKNNEKLLTTVQLCLKLKNER